MNPQPPTDLPCSTIAYRVIRRKTWLDPDNDLRVKAEAFMRRPPKTLPAGVIDPMDEDGLSVYDSFRMNVEDCVNDTLSGHGIVSLHVGTLRDFGLTVIRDNADGRKLLITNLPFENPNDADEERLLDDVAESARIIARQRWNR